MAMRLLNAVFCVLLLALNGQLSLADTTDSPSSQVVSSPNDPREYAYFVLPNQMKVLVVSDPEAESAAVSISIGIGSLVEPEDRQGLAHFLEHMLFKGTKKYPGVEEYMQYIRDHGGTTNAETGTDITNFFFDVDPAYLEGAMDRFSQFFIAPLFNREFVDKERHAVDAEYRLKIKDDARRIRAAMQKAYNAASPNSRFSVGNLETLADRPGHPVYDDLLDFYHSHYSANIMGLVVIGRESTDRLAALVKKYFSAVPNRNYKRYEPAADQMVFPDSILPQQVLIRPLSQQTSAALIFPLPAPTRDYRTNPLDYIATLLKSPVPGGLYTTLRDNGWAGELDVSWDVFDRQQGQLIVTLGLTDKGLVELANVEKAFYSYVDLLKNQGVEAWRYDELKRLTELRFRFLEKSPAQDYAHALSPRLLDYPPEDLLRAGEILMEFDRKKIVDALEYLRPEKATRLIIDQRVDVDQVEKYYQVPYKLIRPVPPLVSNRTFSLKLPGKNPFVPENPVVKPGAQPGKLPVRLEESPGFVVWHLQDGDFRLPKADIRIMLRSPVALQPMRNVILQQLLGRLVAAQLLDEGHQAGLAGLSFELTPSRDGILVHLQGYDEKMDLLFKDILAALRKPMFTAQQFALQKEIIRQSLEEQLHQYAYQRVLAQAIGETLHPYYGVQQQLDALAPLGPDDLKRFVDDYFATLDVTMLVHGNLTPEEARVMSRQLKDSLLQKTRLQPVAGTEAQPPAPGKPVSRAFEVDHPDAVRTELLLGGSTDARAHAYWRLLGQLIAQPFSTELRTRQQLGYVASAEFMPLYRHPSLVMVIQSSNTDQKTLGKRMEAFQQAFAGMLDTLDDKTLDVVKQTLADALTQPDRRLYERSGRYFDDILYERTHFAFRERVAEELKKISRDDLKAFYREQVLSNPRKVVVWSSGKFK